MNDIYKKIRINCQNLYFDLNNSSNEELNHDKLVQSQQLFTKDNVDSSDLTIINNSFFLRNNFLSTKKSNKYLGFLGQNPTNENILIAQGIDINKDFKVISKKLSNFPDIKPLNESIIEELNNLGVIVFILIGSIDYSSEISRDINISPYEKLQFDFIQEKAFINQPPPFC